MCHTSIAMERPQHTSAHLKYALRHEFKPSPQLADSLSAFVDAPPGRSFLLMSSKSVLVDGAAYHYEDFRSQREDTERAVEKAKNYKFYIADVAIKALHRKVAVGHGIYEYQDEPYGYRIALRPEPQEAYDILASTLDAYSVDEPREPFSQSEIVDLKHHYMYMDIPDRDVVGPSERDYAIASLAKESTAESSQRLFYARVARIRVSQVPTKR